MTALVHSRWLPRLALGALVAYLLVAIPVGLRNTWLRARAASAMLYESPTAVRARVFGEGYTSAIEDIRRRIPEDEPYILSTTGDMAAMLWVRFDLLPRRAVVPEPPDSPRAGTQTCWIPQIRWLVTATATGRPPTLEGRVARVPTGCAPEPWQSRVP